MFHGTTRNRMRRFGAIIALGLMAFIWGCDNAEDTTSSPTVESRDVEASTPAAPALIDAAPVERCLWQIHKIAKGERQARLGEPYVCDTGKTVSGKMKLRLVLESGGRPCDQNPALVPNGTVLSAEGHVTVREDGFAHFAGRFAIRAPGGDVLFRGTMDLLDRVGTHHAPFGSEACNEKGHLEGWLEGHGSRRLPNHRLRAVIAAEVGPLSTEAVSQPILRASINGTLIKSP